MSDEKAIRESLNETVQSKTQVYHGRVAALAEGAREGGLKF